MPHLLSADITPTNNTFYSDHKIISITLENFLETKGKKRNRPILIPNEELITPHSWSSIKNSISLINLSSSSSLNSKWNQFNNKIIKLKKKHCPTRKIIPKNHSILNEKCSTTYHKLKLISKLICKINQTNSIQSLKNDLNSLSIQTSTPTNSISELKILRKKTHKQLSIEIYLQKKENILEAIDHRISLLNSSPKTLIKNILEHKNPKASFIKLINPNNSELIHSPSNIQQKIQEHYSHIFYSRNINSSLLDK